MARYFKKQCTRKSENHSSDERKVKDSKRFGKSRQSMKKVNDQPLSSNVIHKSPIIIKLFSTTGSSDELKIGKMKWFISESTTTTTASDSNEREIKFIDHERMSRKNLSIYDVMMNKIKKRIIKNEINKNSEDQKENSKISNDERREMRMKLNRMKNGFDSSLITLLFINKAKFDSFMVNDEETLMNAIKSTISSIDLKDDKDSNEMKDVKLPVVLNVFVNFDAQNIQEHIINLDNKKEQSIEQSNIGNIKNIETNDQSNVQYDSTLVTGNGTISLNESMFVKDDKSHSTEVNKEKKRRKIKSIRKLDKNIKDKKRNLKMQKKERIQRKCYGMKDRIESKDDIIIKPSETEETKDSALYANVNQELHCELTKKNLFKRHRRRRNKKENETTPKKHFKNDNSNEMSHHKLKRLLKKREKLIKKNEKVQMKLEKIESVLKEKVSN